MIRFPLHRGCHDQASSTQGVCHDHGVLYIGGVMIRCPLHRGCHDDHASSTQGVS